MLKRCCNTIYQSMCLRVRSTVRAENLGNHQDADKTTAACSLYGSAVWPVNFYPSCSPLILAATANLRAEGQHSVMSRITKGDWQE